MIHLHRIPRTVFTFLAYPLIFHYARLPSCLSLLLALRAKLAFCSAPDVSSPQLIFYCAKLKSMLHLNNEVVDGVKFCLLCFPFLTGLIKDHPVSPGPFIKISFASLAHRRAGVTVILVFFFLELASEPLFCTLFAQTACCPFHVFCSCLSYFPFCQFPFFTRNSKLWNTHFLYSHPITIFLSSRAGSVNWFLRKCSRPFSPLQYGFYPWS